MRILGFVKEWDKFKQGYFTTFRFPRKDKDWQVGELVQIVIHPRSKDRKILGTAEIIEKLPRTISNVFYFTFTPKVLESEAIADGFKSKEDMITWVDKTYKGRQLIKPMNKLTLEWRDRS